MKQRRLPAHPSQIIDRSRNVYFNYEGKRILAYPGDTVASALYASGIDIFSRSFKYHRPRGLLCVSGRCPNCMMNVDGAPNVRACACAATDGMNVAGQNAWPSVENDALSALQYFRPADAGRFLLQDPDPTQGRMASRRAGNQARRRVWAPSIRAESRTPSMSTLTPIQT